MKKRKILLGLALAAAAVFSLSACGDDTEPTTPTTTEDGGSNSGSGTTNGGQDGGSQVTPAKKNFTVNFYSNGGTAVASQTVEEGKKATKPTDPTRTGSVNTYTFAGWYTDVALTQAFSFDTAPTGDVTLYAKWTSTLVEAKKITMNGTEYGTIKEAISAVPADSTDTFTIIVPKGTYNENGLDYNGSATIKIVGATDTKYGADVIIKGHGSNMTQEKTRNLMEIQGTGNIILENLTLESDWTRTGAADAGLASNTQAEVLGTDTKGNTVAYNCSFKSHQDTLRTAGKAWFYGCYIEGDVDFIWMEQAGSVALYEKCEIVSVYDSTASSHASYVTAPRMAKSSKVGKGLVIYNSTVKESAEAKENGQETYLARNPWSSTTDYYNQIAYINTTCSDIESSIWKGSATATDFDATAIGWKMDAATAASLNYTGTAGIVAADTVATEFNGRRTILNRMYNTQKQKYEKDASTAWDIDALILENGFAVDMDASSDVLATDTAGETTVYTFDGSTDLSSMVEGFTAHSSGSYSGGNGATITVPVTGKSFVEVYGFYSGTVEITADTQDGEAVMFFNNNSTGAQVMNTYAVYDAAARSVVLTAKGTTYITKIVVTTDPSVTEEKASGITVTASTTTECVGVPLTLSSVITNKTATNKSVKWSSSDENVATIDPYEGRVTFVAAGEVTFTATACDGSGVTGTYTCKPVDPKWVKAEWYTTDTDVKTEDGVEDAETHVVTGKATEIGNFNTNSSAYKSLGKTYTFTNIAGETISTNKGLKLNSAGKLSISTTKGNATLTVVIVTENGQVKATPIVHAGTTNAELLSTTVNADTTTTYVYSIPTAATWDIERGDTQSENNPILYAVCEYATKISKNTFVNFKGGSYHAVNTDAVVVNHNNDEDGIRMTSAADNATYDLVTYNGVSSNGKDNWLKFNDTNTIKYTTNAASILRMYFYQGNNNAVVTLNGTTVTPTSSGTGDMKAYEYAFDAAGEVVITASGNGYIGAFEVDFTSTPTVPVVVTDSTDKDVEIVFGTNCNIDSVTGVTYTATINNANANNGQVKNGSITLAVKAGAKVTVYGYGGSHGTNGGDYTSYTVTANGSTSDTQNKDYEVVVAADGDVVITAVDGNNYLMSIKIEYPVPSTDKDVEIVFGADCNIDSIEGVTYTATINNANATNAQVKNGSITLAVKAGAKVTVYGYGGSHGTNGGDYTSYTVTANGSTSDTQNKDYEVVVAADGDVVITAVDGNNYLMSIKVEYSIGS